MQYNVTSEFACNVVHTQQQQQKSKNKNNLIPLEYHATLVANYFMP